MRKGHMERSPPTSTRCFYQIKKKKKKKDLLIDKGGPNNQPHQIIPTFDLTTLVFNSIFAIDFLEIQSHNECVYISGS